MTASGPDAELTRTGTRVRLRYVDSESPLSVSMPNVDEVLTSGMRRLG